MEETKMKKNKKFKKGAASFYIVAFATLILMILATSFAAVIISEITRTSNDDLSQSAYDSAMAGVEDAKLAYYSYRNCMIQENAGGECETIKDIMNKSKDTEDCDMVGKILGRNYDESVVVEEKSNVGNNMQQAYTCVTMTDSLPDYSSSVEPAGIDVVHPRFDDGVTADKVNEIEINWYDSTKNNQEKHFVDPSNPVLFSKKSEEVPVPPMLYLAVLQTGGEVFNYSDFDTSKGNQTNRGMVYLVPTKDKNKAGEGDKEGYWGSWKGEKNTIGEEALLNSNRKTAKIDGDKGHATNRPYLVYCNDDSSTSQYLCSARIKLPEPINGGRNGDTFTVVVGMPYGNGSTDFTLSFYCKEENCGVYNPESGDGSASNGNQAKLKGVQVQVDSTGKANDLYRRVEVRLKPDSSVLSVMGPLELLGKGEPGLEKQYEVNCERNFPNKNC